MKIHVDVSSKDIKALRKRQETGASLTPIENAILQQFEFKANTPTRIYKYSLERTNDNFVVVIESYPIYNVTDKWVTYRIPRFDKLYETKVIRKVYKRNLDRLQDCWSEMWSFDKKVKNKFIDLVTEEQKKRLNKALNQCPRDEKAVAFYRETTEIFEHQLKLNPIQFIKY